MASAESLPDELAGCADEVRIQFPWGSLLRAILHADRALLTGVAGLLCPGGTLHVLVSVVERDRVKGVSRLDEREAGEVARGIAGAGAGIALERWRQATPEDVAASHSTWGKRLGVGRSRQAWVLRFRAAEPA